MRKGAPWFSLSLLLAFAVAADRPAVAQLRAGAVYTSAEANSDTPFPRLRVVLTPPDPHVLPLAADLTLVEDGRSQKHAVDVRSFESTGYPLAAAVVIDASGSMKGRPIEIVRESLAKFVDDARAKDKIAVMTVADDARWDAPFGADRVRVKQLLSGVEARGHLTRLYDGMVQAIGGFEPSLPQRRELTVISDGHDEGSRATLEQVISMARERGIAIDAIGLTRAEPQYLRTLEQMAAETGGSFRQVQNDEELRALVANGIANLKATPVAAFDCERIAPDGKHHSLSVRWKKVGAASNEVNFYAPTHAARPVQYFFRHLPVWAWGAAAAIVVLLVVAIIWGVVRARGRRGKADDEADVPPPAPWVPNEFQPSHAPTMDMKAPTVDRNPSTDDRKMTEFPPPPTGAFAQGVAASAFAASGPVAQSSAATSRKTQLGGIFPGTGEAVGLLEGEAGMLAGRSFEIPRAAAKAGRFWIGAAPECAVRIEGDPTVSGYHACLIYEEPILFLADQSTNGTRLNGELVRGERRSLRPGDRVQIGRTLFRVIA